MDFWRMVKGGIKISSFVFLFVFLLFVIIVTFLRVLSPNWSIVDILQEKNEKAESYTLSVKVVDNDTLTVYVHACVRHGQPTWDRCLYWGDGKDKICLESPACFDAYHTYSKKGRYLIRLMSDNINLIKPVPVDFRE